MKYLHFDQDLTNNILLTINKKKKMLFYNQMYMIKFIFLLDNYCVTIRPFLIVILFKCL